MTDQPTLSELSAAATPGEWSAYLYREEITGDDAPAGILCNLNGQPVGDDMEHANADFLAALVNAFRAGALVDVCDLASLVKPLVWEENRNDYWTAKGTGYQVAHNGDGTWRVRLHGKVTHRRRPSFSKAKAAAEAHWIAQVLAAFDLPAKEEDL